MKWYSDLYVGETAKKNQNRILRQIRARGKCRNIFLVTLPANSSNLLDIIPSRFAFHYDDLHVIGVAKGKKEACDVAASIIDEVYRETGAFDIVPYLKQKQQGQDV